MDLNSQINRKYSVLVAGDIDLQQFNMNQKVQPYVVYRFSDRKEIRKNAIEIYQSYILNIPKENFFLKEILSTKLQEIQEMTDEEYFEFATKNMEYDEKTGDALSDFNPKGKYKQLFEPTLDNALPLLNNSFQCKAFELPDIKKNDEIKIYSDHWDNVMSLSSDLKESYLFNYKNKETFLSVMAEPLFYNAFASEETGWVEQGDEDQIQWVLNFRKRFIQNLSENTILKVYNFTK